jgi:hypothetical protein
MAAAERPFLNGVSPMNAKHLLLAAAALAALASPAAASSRADGCTKAPQADWAKIEMSEAKAKADGYVVSKSKISGSCHEVYASKDGKRFELFYDPTNQTLIETVAK